MNFKKVIGSSPQTPGVYLFKNKRGKILYVGKAVNLRARLRSYLNPGWKDQMIREAATVSWEELSSDIEALIREAELIKKYKPRFNILFRDDKNYFFVAFTKELFPRIYLTHQPHLEAKLPNGSLASTVTAIGPFTEGEPLKRVLHFLRRAFPYCTCSSKIRHKRKCVNAEIGKCLGFCCADIAHTKKDVLCYRANIASIKKVLAGKTKILERTLAKKMAALSRRRRYEDARVTRDQVASLGRIFQHSPYIKKDLAHDRSKALRALQELLRLRHFPTRIEGYDISHHQGDTSVASMVVFEEGLPAKNEYRKFIMRSVSGINDPAMIYEVLARRLTHREWQTPDLIVVDGGKAQLSAALCALKTSDVHWTSDVPQPSLVAIAKHEEELYVPLTKNPLKLKELPPPLLHLIAHVRDEAHRFAISFHRKRRRTLALR